MEEKTKSKNNIVTIILVIIIMVLLIYIAFGNKIFQKNAAKNIGNNALMVLDELKGEEIEGSEEVILRIKNTSSQTFTDASPVLIYYDANNNPFREGWGPRIGYWAPGEIRCIRFYDAIKDYSKAELGLFESEDSNSKIVDLRDKIEYDVKKEDSPDEDGEIRLTFKGKNKYDKPVAVEFQIDYFSGKKLIYEDQFNDVIEANSSFDTYEYYFSKYYNGEAFPEGYTYEVNLVEAIEYIEDEYVDEDYLETDIPEDTVDDRIESALFKQLKSVYGDDMDSAKIYIDKTYTAEEAKEYEGVKDLELGENDVAFESTIYILPAEGADPNKFTIPNGEYDEDSGWVSEIKRLGVLRKTEDGEYEITDFGTGW